MGWKDKIPKKAHHDDVKEKKEEKKKKRTRIVSLSGKVEGKGRAR